MKKRSITILCADVSINCLSRALTLAEIIADNNKVQIIGFARQYKNIWKPASNSSIPIHALSYGGPANWQRARKVVARAGAVSSLVVCKPRLTSMGLALHAGIRPDHAILDINDWELGLALESRRDDGGFSFLDLCKNPASANSPMLAWHYEKKIKNFPLRIVNNHWLQQRFGGELLYDVRNTDLLDPAKFDRQALRSSLRLDDRPWVIFAGTPRPHKGLEVLLDALTGFAGDKAPGLMCCGSGNDPAAVNAFIETARSKLGGSRVFHSIHYRREEVSRYLAAADIACIPALSMSNTVGQVPTKLFEAMAMGLPVIASDICDMPELVRGIGITVKAGDSNDLAVAIRILAEDETRRIEYSNEARRRAVGMFSYRAGTPVVTGMLEQLP